MLENWSNKQTDFWNLGYCLFDNLIPESYLKEWKHRVEWLTKYSTSVGVNHINKTFTEANLAARDGVGSYKFTSIDGRACFEFPGIKEYYNSISTFLSLFTGLDIVESFDRQSSISFMHYPAPGGGIAPHFDSNGITFLLYLTDNEDGGTKIQPINTLRPTVLGQPDEVIGEPIIVLPKFGKIVVFQSRKVWHQSLPVEKTNKVSSVWNFYERGDNWRPKEVSERLYK